MYQRDRVAGFRMGRGNRVRVGGNHGSFGKRISPGPNGPWGYGLGLARALLGAGVAGGGERDEDGEEQRGPGQGRGDRVLER